MLDIAPMYSGILDFGFSIKFTSVNGKCPKKSGKRILFSCLFYLLLTLIAPVKTARASEARAVKVTRTINSG